MPLEGHWEGSSLLHAAVLGLDVVASKEVASCGKGRECIESKHTCVVTGSMCDCSLAATVNIPVT